MFKTANFVHSSNLRKVKLLLDAFERIGRDTEYYALDLSLSELHRTLSQLPSKPYAHVRCYGLHGTYDDGLAWLNSPAVSERPKCIISLGSSVGNFTRQEAAKFLGDIARALQPRDRMIVALDGCKDTERVFRAYNDGIGLTHKFVLNGLANANRILGEDVFKKGEWTVVGEYDELAGGHRAFYVPVTDVTFGSIKFKAGERVLVEESNKYDDEDRHRLWLQAGLSEGARWANSLGDYRMCALVFLNNVKFLFPLCLSTCF
jgi:EasF-like predicted methyltransferase